MLLFLIDVRGRGDCSWELNLTTPDLPLCRLRMRGAELCSHIHLNEGAKRSTVKPLPLFKGCYLTRHQWNNADSGNLKNFAKNVSHCYSVGENSHVE